MTDKEFKNAILKQQPYMQKVAEKLLGDTDNAEDAVQEAVIGLWRQRQSLKTSTDLKALCGTIVKRRCIDMLRRQQPNVPLDEGLMLAEPDPDEYSEERYLKARQIVDHLPARQRDVILMKYEEGMDQKAIEKATGMSSTHVYATLSRAYKALREALTKNKEEQP